MHKLRWLVLALLTIAALAAAGCGGDDDSGGGDGGGDAGGEPIKIGASLPLTGEFSEPGKAAQQGYEVWEAMVNDSGGLLDGRPVEDGHQGRPVEPEHDRRRLQRADQPGQGRPAARHVLVAAQPAGVRGRRAEQDALRRAGRRRAGACSTAASRYLFFAQQATADKQGERLGELGDPAARGRAPEDGRLPDARRPVRAADLEGIEEIFSKAGHQDRLPRDLPDRQPRTSTRSPARSSRGTRTSSSTAATFEDGVGPGPRAPQGPASRRRCSTRPRPRRSATSTRRRSASENDRGHLLRGEPLDRRPTTPGNEEFVAKYQEMFGGTEVPEDAADAYAAAQVLQAAVEAVGTIDRASAGARRLAARRTRSTRSSAR